MKHIIGSCVQGVVKLCAMKYILTIIVSSLLILSCKNNSINVTKKEFKENERQGFWVVKNKKAIHYNQTVAKPKRDKQMAKLARENKQIEKQNNKNKTRYSNNEVYLKTFEHH